VTVIIPSSIRVRALTTIALATILAVAAHPVRDAWRRAHPEAAFAQVSGPVLAGPRAVTREHILSRR